MKKFLFLLTFLFLLLPISSYADSMTYDFTLGNFDLSGYSSPYAQVTIEVDSSSNTATFHMTLDSGLLDDGAGIMSFGFNSNITDLTSSNFTVLPSDWNFWTDRQQDGFGNFDYVIGNTAEDKRVSVLDFTISGNSAIDTYTDFYFPSTSGQSYTDHHFASHIGPNNLTQTGFITDGDTPPPVPEPATMLLLGSGLVGLAGLRKKFKK